jgi:hypothetical protein
MSMANKRGLTIMHLLLASVFFAGCNEVSTTHYETTDDAVRDRATERGVIPQILQPDVTDIHETHDLDSGRVDGSFALNGSVVFRLKSACSPSQALPPTPAAHTGGSVPRKLESKLHPANPFSVGISSWRPIRPTELATFGIM